MLESLLSYISVQAMIWLIVAIPLAGFVINGAISLVVSEGNFSEPRRLVIFIAEFAAILSFVAVILIWYILYGLEEAMPSVITGPLFSWKGFLNQPITFGLKADQLSLSVAIMISFVGVASHLYSVGFMSASTRVATYFSLLNLAFSLTMLLVLTDSFLMFFVVWQVIGVVGLVFISRYFRDLEGIRAGTIYYIIEAISGSSFLLVMILIWKAFLGEGYADLDTFHFSSIQMGSGLMLPFAGVVCSALIVSLTARSLQFPFYIWLPEASRSSPIPVFLFMYGVSFVLVVTYVLVRLNFLLVLAPNALGAVAFLGGIGAVFGAASALVQKDARKVIAYFIISQAGLAFLSVGVGAFATALFHVFTYATYISAILFGIGSVVFVTGGDSFEDVGGLRKYLPVTFWTTLVGVLSACGIYPLSGFFGKNSVIWEVYQRGHDLLFVLAFISTMLGTIALFRMVALVFFGKFDRRRELPQRMEEASVSMLVVMVIVSFASIVVGWFGVPEAFGGRDLFGGWLTPGLATQMVHVMGESGRFSEVVLAVITTLFIAHAGLVTWIIYVQKRAWPAGLARRFNVIHMLLQNGFYLNRLYSMVIERPIRIFSEWVLWKGLDRVIINGVFVGGIGRIGTLCGEILTRFQAESFTIYIFWMIVGLAIFVAWCLF